MPLRYYDFSEMEDNDVILVLYRQNFDVYVDPLKKMSKNYNIDLRLFAINDGMTLCRNIEVIDGKITKNELVVPENDGPRNWPDFDFGDASMQTKRAYNWECKMSSKLSDAQSVLLEGAAELQKKHFVDKCPCCGEDEMLTFEGKTDGWPSQQGGVYICHHCGFDELDETNRPLSRWAVINSAGIESEEESDLVLL